MDTFLLDEQLRNFLREDLEHGDITTYAIFSGQETAAVTIPENPLLQQVWNRSRPGASGLQKKQGAERDIP